MTEEIETWLASHQYLPAGADEATIASSKTSDLEAAQRLMSRCDKKPAVYQIEVSIGQIGHHPDYVTPVFDYIKAVVLNESLRYPMVCKELARRAENDAPALALQLYEEAMLPGSCLLAYETHEAYMADWERHGKQADEAESRILKAIAEGREWLARQLKSKSSSHEAADEKIDDGFWQSVIEWAFSHALLDAQFAISQEQPRWNFWIMISMARNHTQIRDLDKAGQLRAECLEVIQFNDDLWAEVFDSMVSRGGAGELQPRPASPSPVRGMDSDLIGELNATLGQVKLLVTENVRISQSIESRLDLVVERLIDLDQRSELTWLAISQSAKGFPEYEGDAEAIEKDLAGSLSDTWAKLQPESKEDLIDAEYIYRRCSSAKRGWRMAVLGFCTAIERELAEAYRRLLGLSWQKPQRDSLLDLLELLAQWDARMRGKPNHNLRSLLKSTADFDRLNNIRNRSAHAKPRAVSQGEAEWTRKAVTGDLLRVVASVR